MAPFRSLTKGNDAVANEQTPEKRSALDRFLSGISESIFQTKLGVADVQLIGYVSDLMLRFVRIDAVHKMRRNDGRPATEVFQLLCEAERRIGIAKREVHRHIGDVTLFWSGMFPESVRGDGKDSPDQLLDYFQHGKRSYKIASTIEADESRPPCDLLDRLSDQFELCAYGLREIRREIDEAEPGEQLLLS
nr:hypothetical protein [Rhodopirellula sp. JC740]